VPWDLLVKDVPADHHHDLDYLIEMLDWDANTDPEFAEHRLFEPKPVCPAEQMQDAGYNENWVVVYSTSYYSAKELTCSRGYRHHPGSAAYGTILVQGWGSSVSTRWRRPR